MSPAKVRDERIELRVARSETKVWRRAADELGLSLSAWIRMQCNLASKEKR